MSVHSMPPLDSILPGLWMIGNMALALLLGWMVGLPIC